MESGFSPAWLRPPEHERRGPRDPLITPPESPRKRIRYLRDSEDTDGEMTLESYLYRTNPYRSSTISNPPPYPVDIKELPENEYQPHYSQIEQILYKHGFPSIHALVLREGIAPGQGYYMPKGRFQVVQLSKPNYPGGETPKTAFLITFFDGGLPRQLGPARDEIREFLWMQGLRVDVEISIMGYFRQLIFPISPRDRTVQPYKDAESRIISFLNETLRSHWEGLSLLNIGFTQDKVTPTVLVYVPPAMSFDWSFLRLKILALISLPEIDVTFHPGAVTGSTYPGSSIGTRGSGSSGTLGGYFDLKIHGETRKGFLTNYHVIQPRTAPEDVRERADRFGHFPTTDDDDDEYHREVMSPSEEDVTADTKYAKKWEEYFQQEKAKAIEKRDENESNGMPTDNLSSQITMATESIQFQQQQLANLNSLPFVLGKVLLSSGLAWFGSRISDWAFVELENGQPSLPNTMPQYPAAMAREFHKPPGAPATGFGEIKTGQTYLKHGRTTGVTVGVCNGVYMFVPEHVRHLRGMPTLSLTSSPRGSWEFLIVPTDDLTNFVKPGDSGSLVYDVTGKICGLLFGQVKSHLITSGLVTTFPDVRKAIKEKGGVLTDPNIPEHEDI